MTSGVSRYAVRVGAEVSIGDSSLVPTGVAARTRRSDTAGQSAWAVQRASGALRTRPRRSRRGRTRFPRQTSLPTCDRYRVVTPLALALQPLTPVRTPRMGRPTALYGYQLRLADGLVVTSDDPLLRAFAASIDAIEEMTDDEA